MSIIFWCPFRCKFPKFTISAMTLIIVNFFFFNEDVPRRTSYTSYGMYIFHNLLGFLECVVMWMTLILVINIIL